jgi:uncharacterized protein YggE
MCDYDAIFPTGDTMFKRIAFILALAAFGTAASASNLPEYPFAHVTGSARTYVPPDIGEIDFEIIISDASPETAQTLMEERVAAVRAVLVAQSIPEGDIQTRNVRREMSKDGSIYALKCTVRISVRDLTKWVLVMQPLLNMPNLDGFMTAFVVTDREKVATELMTMAIKDARVKAANIALGSGRKLGEVTAVTSGQLKNITTAMGLAPSIDPYARPVNRREQSNKDFLMIEIQEFQQPVDVIFRLR